MGDSLPTPTLLALKGTAFFRPRAVYRSQDAVPQVVGKVSKRAHREVSQRPPRTADNLLPTRGRRHVRGGLLHSSGASRIEADRPKSPLSAKYDVAGTTKRAPRLQRESVFRRSPRSLQRLGVCLRENREQHGATIGQHLRSSCRSPCLGVVS